MSAPTENLFSSPPAATPLAELMKVEFLFNEAGKVWLLHNRPLPAVFSWAEYDADEASLILVADSGLMVPLGLAVPAAMGLGALKAEDITIMQMDDSGKTVASSVLPIILRDLSSV